MHPGERCTVGTDGIRRISDAFHWNAQETHRKIETVFQPEYCFHFRCFPAGYNDFSAPFLQDPAGYGGRNLRPGFIRFLL